MQDLIDFFISKTSGGKGSSFLGDFNLDFFVKLNELVSGLSIEQTLSFIHISGALTILFCLSSIISVLWGNFLIEYFRLDERFPSLSRFISLRKKFTNYFLILDVLLITGVAIGEIYANLLYLGVI